MTTALSKRLFSDCEAFVCLPFGFSLVGIAFFMAIGFVEGVMSISFALTIDLYKPLSNSEKC